MKDTKRSLARLALAATLMAPVLGSIAGCAADGGKTAETGREKLILQVTDGDPAKWNLTLNVAGNVQEALGKDKVDIEIVAYGPGIGMLKSMGTAEPRVSAALAAGVRVVACESTMTAFKLSKADMMPGIGYVPGGVIEIMQRQREGWIAHRP